MRTFDIELFSVTADTKFEKEVNQKDTESLLPNNIFDTREFL